MTSSAFPAAAMPAAEPEALKTPKKAALASWIGSAVEYYDFFIYGTAAALIFPKLFFAPNNPQAAAIASFATFGVAYVTRPLGAVALGHVGDRFGRKKVLTFTLLLMGISTFMIGCLPTYDQIGILAPILLVVARLLQRIEHEVGVHGTALAPTHNSAAEHVNDECHIDPTLPGRDVGEVRDP